MKRCRQSLALLSRLVDDDVRKQVLRECQQHEYEKGEQIVREMDEDNNVYFIDEGCARVMLYSCRGREVSFIDLYEGDNFGELSAIDGRPRSANVVALKKTRITVMHAEVFLELLTRYPSVNLYFLRQLTSMVRRLCDRIFEYSTLGVVHRIHAELLRIARQNIDLDGVARIKNMPTHAQLGSRLSCNREAVSRELSELERLGIIARVQRKFIIEDVSKLEQLVEINKHEK